MKEKIMKKINTAKEDRYFLIFLNTVVISTFIFIFIKVLEFIGAINIKNIENVIFSLPNIVIFLLLLSLVSGLYGVGFAIEQIKPTIKRAFEIRLKQRDTMERS